MQYKQETISPKAQNRKQKRRRAGNVTKKVNRHTRFVGTRRATSEQLSRRRRSKESGVDFEWVKRLERTRAQSWQKQ